MARLAEFFKDLVSFTGALLTLVAVFVPFVGKLAPNVRHLLPPWPGDTSAPLIATVLSVFVAAAIYSVFGGATKQRDSAVQHHKMAKLLLGAGIILIPIHLGLATLFIQEYGPTPSYTITRFGLTEAAVQLVPSGDVGQLLDEFGHNSQHRCWYGHNVVRWLVFLSFLAMLATWTGTFSFSLLYHRDDHE